MINYVKPLKFNNQCCWIKYRGEDKRNLITQTTNCLVQLFTPKNADFRLYSVLSSRERFANEASKLKTFTELGLATPKVILETKCFFITKSAGKPLNIVNDKPETELFNGAFNLLSEYHSKGAIHGRPALRDILIDENNNFTFIDFEEARISRHALLQVRDVLLLLLDTYRLESVTQETRLLALLKWESVASSDVCKYLNRVLTVISPLIWLPKSILLFKNNRLSKQIIQIQELLERYQKETTGSKRVYEGVEEMAG